MIFEDTTIVGAHLVLPAQVADHRGSFARTFDADEFRGRGLEPRVAQCSTSYNLRRHTLRGLHFQRAPHAEVKLVRCTSGRIFDVVVDLRRDSPTYRTWFGALLTAERGEAMYIPAGCAHGFMTLEDRSTVYYQMSHRFEPDAAAGVRWDDPAIAIEWPAVPEVMSERDRSYPDLVD